MTTVALPTALEALGPLALLGQGTERVRIHGVLGLRADGVVGCGSRQLIINSPEGLQVLHALRAGHDAVVVGSATCRVDDPRLTVRAVVGLDPLPVVLATGLDVAPGSNLARRGALVYCGPDAEMTTRPDLNAIAVAVGPDGRLDLDAVVADLAERGIRRVLVEGGPTIVEAFAAAGLLDAIVLLLNPAVGVPLADEVRFDLATSAVRFLPEQLRMPAGDDIAIVLGGADIFGTGAAA